MTCNHDAKQGSGHECIKSGSACKAHIGCHDHAAHADMNTASGRRKVGITCLLTGGFMVIEAVGGVISGSLALLADAAHMLTDSASLALAWLGYLFAVKKPDEMHSFGFSRIRVLAAFTNGIVLVALACWILIEGVIRMLDPPPVVSSTMLLIAIGGFAINLIAAFILHGGNEKDINLTGAYLHVLGDLLGSVAAIVAAIVIFATGWMIVDPLLSMLVAILILYAGIRFSIRAGHILIQGAPNDLTPEMVHTEISTKISGVRQVQNVQVWMLTEEESVVTIQVRAADSVCTETLRQSVKSYLKTHMQVHKVTVEISSDKIQDAYFTDMDSTNDSDFYIDRKAG